MRYTLISKLQYERLNLLDSLSQVSIHFRIYDAEIITLLGAIEAFVTYKGCHSKEKFFVWIS